MPSVVDNLGKSRFRSKPRKYKGLTWSNKHIARDISRSCNMPYEEALKLLQVIIKLWQVKLKSEGLLTLRGLGRLKLSKLKKPNNRAAYRVITFQMSAPLRDLLDNKRNYRYYEYEIRLAHQIRRLWLAGEKMKALKYSRTLDARIIKDPECGEFMAARNYWPPKLWKNLN